MRVDDIQTAMYEAMKARRGDEAAALRLLLAELRSAEIETQGELDDEQVAAVMRREAKKRREAEAAYRDAGRADRADQEAFELSIISRYLPAQLDRADLERMVDDAIATSGATSPRELGKVMGVLMPQVKGRADGNEVRKLVQARLS
jgi:uncharacterized protein YqeY